MTVKNTTEVSQKTKINIKSFHILRYRNSISLYLSPINL